MVKDEARFTSRDSLDFGLYHEIHMDFQPTDPCMVTLLSFLPRKQDMSPRAFHKYWRTNHVDVARSTESWNDSVRHYIQNHSINEIDPERDTTYDGIAELRFDDHQSVLEWVHSEDYQEIIAPDGTNFINDDESTRVIAEVHPIV